MSFCTHRYKIPDSKRIHLKKKFHKIGAFSECDSVPFSLLEMISIFQINCYSFSRILKRIVVLFINDSGSNSIQS